MKRASREAGGRARGESATPDAQVGVANVVVGEDGLVKAVVTGSDAVDPS